MTQMQNPYEQPYRVRREHHVVRRVVLVVVLVLLAYVACLGVSAYRMYGSATQLRNQYEELSRDLQGHSYDDAATTALSMGDTASELASESQSWPWQLLGSIPLAQDDVTVLQGLTTCASDLTSGALQPVAEAYQQLVADGVVQSGTVSLRALASHQDDVTQLGSAVSAASSTVQTCQAEVEALPACNIAALNSAKSTVASSLGQAAESLGSVGSTASSQSVLSLLS